MKKCIDCGNDVPELEAFPGPRCLTCHARKFDSVPLSQQPPPDFTNVFNKRKGKR